MKLNFKPNIYLPIEKKNFSIVQPVVCGREVCKPGHSCNRPISNYLIHYVENGKGILKKNDKIYHISKGQCFVIFPGETYFYQADREEPWTYMWVGFNGEIAEKLKNLDSPIFNSSAKYFIEMLNCVNFNDMADEYLAAKIIEFMCHEFSQKRKGNYADIAKSMVDSNYDINITIKTIADSIGIDKRYLSRIFKEKYNITLKNYIIQKKMSDAQFLLKAGYNVGETSKMVGYSDEFVFSRAFKNEFGYPPKELKKQKKSD